MRRLSQLLFNMKGGHKTTEAFMLAFLIIKTNQLTKKKTSV